VTARRGFATSDLIAAWQDVVGERFADFTRPERIAWPHGKDAAAGGTLHLRVDGPRAVLVQHELGQIIERVNSFLGYGAIARVRLLQGEVAGHDATREPVADLAAADAERLGAAIAPVEGEALRGALGRLGRHVLSRG
jgi:hypothetical protein